MYLVKKFSFEHRHTHTWAFAVPGLLNILVISKNATNPHSSSLNLVVKTFFIILTSPRCIQSVLENTIESTVSTESGRLRLISHLRFYRAILSRNLIARPSCNTQLCMSHTATLSHKQAMTNQLGQCLFMQRSCSVRHHVQLRAASLSRDKSC